MSEEKNVGLDRDDKVQLSPEQLKMVIDAQQAKVAGAPTFSEAEVLERSRAKVRAWLPTKSA